MNAKETDAPYTRVRAIKRNVKTKPEAMWIEGDLHRGHMVWTVDGISCSPPMPISGTSLGLFGTTPTA
jgi:hypothetical protein